jgi:HlyD family secretion protein
MGVRGRQSADEPRVDQERWNAMKRLSMPMFRPFAATAVLLGLAGGLNGCEKKVVETPKDQARTVSVVSVSQHQIEGGLSASGQLTPRETISIYPQVSGYRVAKVFVDVGDQVKAGQPLVQLDDTLLTAQLAQAVALAQQQAVQADQAEAQAVRVKGLDGQGILSQEQIDTRRFAARSARAQAAAQTAAVQDLRTRESLMMVRAPRAGLIIERNVQLGDLSGAGTTPLYRMAENGQIELAADVSLDALGKMRPGASARVTLGDGAQVTGVVRLVGPAVDPNTKLGKVRITLPVRADVHSGDFAQATFLGGSRSTLAVPETAVRYDANGASVMAVGSDDRLVRVPVTTGERGNGWVELLTGPPEGARVVEKAGAMFVPGDFVKVAPTS